MSHQVRFLSQLDRWMQIPGLYPIATVVVTGVMSHLQLFSAPYSLKLRAFWGEDFLAKPPFRGDQPAVCLLFDVPDT